MVIFDLNICVSLHDALARFPTNSFFVGPVEQSHVDVVTEKLGGPKLKVGMYHICIF